jgi:glycosyltransferase involved in cell wall biosynthesis
MACGTPVLSSATTSLPEVVGESGVLVDPESVESICHGLRELAEDEELCRRLQKEGLERAKLFSWDKTVVPLKQLLERLEK